MLICDSLRDPASPVAVVKEHTIRLPYGNTCIHVGFRYPKWIHVQIDTKP